MRQGLAALAARTQADELMVAGAIYDHRARLRSYEILADLMAEDQQQAGASAREPAHA